ncbi:MAG: hypothetical protein KC635_24215 [Myxococcales bacterium]|nr:hypothetical protein [Myxococcales bacterium]MCB9733030.1 hypothetical protein [Deltaproteobacteria bacterium]
MRAALGEPSRRARSGRDLRATMTLAAAAVAALALAGCPHEVRAPEPDPALAVVAYRDALVAGRVDDAFALIHPDAREGMDLAAFRAFDARYHDAIVEQAERLVAAARAGTPEQRATVRTAAGDSTLLLTPEGWRLTAPVGAGSSPPEPAAEAAP